MSEVTTFDFGDVCIGTIEDEQTAVNAQRVVSFGPRAMLQLNDQASGRLERLKGLEPGFVTFVGADGVELTTRDYQAIAAIPGLRSVDFDNSPITDDQVAFFCRDGIIGLNLGTPTVGDGALRAIASLQTLEHLYLSRSSVSDAGLRFLRDHPSLSVLHLAETNVSAASADVIASLSQLSTLHLDRPDDAVVLGAARPHTTWLHFREATISPRGLEALSACANLETFALLNSVLDDDTARALQHLTAPNALFLNGASFADAAMADGLRGLHSLEFVGLARTPAGDVTAAVLGALPNLTTLALADSAVTDDGLRSLAGSRSLQSLHLARTAVTDRGIAHLAAIATLEDLNTDGTAVTEAGRAQLAQLARPFVLG